MIEQWRGQYNTRRPHSSLGYRPPAPEAYHPVISLNAIPQSLAVWSTLTLLGTKPRSGHLAALGIIASLLAFNWRRIPLSWAAYVFVGILWFHSRKPDSSTLRYDAGLFPVYFLGASAFSTISRWSAAALIGVPIQAILAVRHFAGKWVA